MSYFSRLTDIVTCKLSEILEHADDPQVAIERIISEMEEGLAGASRSVSSALASEERLRTELEEHRVQVGSWTSRAKQELEAGSEDQARQALMRKREVEDVIAGLQQQHQAAIATRDHLSTTLRAIEARLIEARRKLQQLESSKTSEHPDAPPSAAGIGSMPDSPLSDDRAKRIEAELEALKRELRQN